MSLLLVIRQVASHPFIHSFILREIYAQKHTKIHKYNLYYSRGPQNIIEIYHQAP